MTMTSRKGFVLPTVIFAITIMSVIVVAALSTASDERRASRASRETTLAMYAAEAGLRQTYGAWPSVAVKALNPGDSLDLGWQNLPNKAAYRTVIHRVDKGALQEYSVVVQGRRTDPTAGIVTIVGAVGGVPIFRNGVYTDGALYLDNGGLFDAYDSDVGPYAAGGPDSTALWANGDLYVAQMDIIPCPVGGFTPTASVPPGPGISYSSVSGVLTVSSGKTLTLTGTSYFFSSIVLTGNAKLVFPGSPAVNVVLRDSINAGSGIIVNQSNIPGALAFASCGTSATPAYWALSSSGTSSRYTVYAPNHVVYELGAGDFYGAIVAQIYYATGGGKFHYDAALARLPSAKLAVQRGSWAQLPGS
jgi:type II secretory pathway pseudopilin PulG